MAISNVSHGVPCSKRRSEFQCKLFLLCRKINSRVRSTSARLFNVDRFGRMRTSLKSNLMSLSSRGMSLSRRTNRISSRRDIQQLSITKRKKTRKKQKQFLLFISSTWWESVAREISLGHATIPVTIGNRHREDLKEKESIDRIHFVCSYISAVWTKSHSISLENRSVSMLTH